MPEGPRVRDSSSGSTQGPAKAGATRSPIESTRTLSTASSRCAATLDRRRSRAPGFLAVRARRLGPREERRCRSAKRPRHEQPARRGHLECRDHSGRLAAGPSLLRLVTRAPWRQRGFRRLSTGCVVNRPPERPWKTRRPSAPRRCVRHRQAAQPRSQYLIARRAKCRSSGTTRLPATSLSLRATLATNRRTIARGAPFRAEESGERGEGGGVRAGAWPHPRSSGGIAFGPSG